MRNEKKGLFPHEKRENEKFDNEEFLMRKTDEKDKELTTLKLRILGIYQANLVIIKRKFCLKSKISKNKLSHKNAINSKIWPKILPPCQQGQCSLDFDIVGAKFGLFRINIS